MNLIFEIHLAPKEYAAAISLNLWPRRSPLEGTNVGELNTLEFPLSQGSEVASGSPEDRVAESARKVVRSVGY